MSYSKRSLSIIVPIYNEAEMLPTVLPALLEYCGLNGFKLILVNDGSKDGSLSIMNKMCTDINFVCIINHKLNRGYGAAIKSGIEICETEFAITIDADGQHFLEDIDKLYNKCISEDADMVIGSRKGLKSASWFRGLGKGIIRFIAKLLMPIEIHDINSGMKLYNTRLAQKYLSLYPDSMAFSDIIALVFINTRQRVIEVPIEIKERAAGESTIGIHTAFDTVLEIVNIVTLFNPMRIFFPTSIMLVLVGIVWGGYILFLGKGLSVGSSFLIISGMILLFMGLLTEQVSQLRFRGLER